MLTWAFFLVWYVELVQILSVTFSYAVQIDSFFSHSLQLLLFS
jgi:hypothetical protein